MKHFSGWLRPVETDPLLRGECTLSTGSREIESLPAAARRGQKVCGLQDLQRQPTGVIGLLTFSGNSPLA